MTQVSLRRLAPLAILLVTTGCVSTRLTSVWRDPQAPPPALEKVMVIAVAAKPGHRQLVENEFVKGFQAYGIEAIASGTIMAPDVKLERETVEQAIQGRGIDSVIVTRLMGIDTEVREVPGTAYVASTPYYGGYYPYYSHAYVVAVAPGETQSYDTILLETVLYVVGRDQMLWSAASETFDPQSVDRLAEALRIAIFRQLEKDGIVKD